MTNLPINQILQGDCLEVLRNLPDESIDCVVTSPPYWALRDYGVDGQLGLEPTFQEYITKLCDIFDEVRRVLKKEGTCWVNIGDTYGGSGKGAGGYSDKSTLAGFTSANTKGRRMAKESWNFEKAPKENGVAKCLSQIPSRFAIEMTNRGWILRNEIIWHKPNCMPSSVKDRFTVDFEKVFFFVKSKKYAFNQQLEPYLHPVDRWGGETVREYKGKYTKEDGEKFNSPRARNSRVGYPERQRELRPNAEGKNKRTVWSINTKPLKEAHFATYPEALIEPMIKAGCPVGGIVLDPFFGAGTTAVVALKQNKNYIGIELNPEYIKIAEARLSGLVTPLI